MPEEVRRGDLHGGFTPDLRKKERGLDRVGAVMFDRRDDHPRQFSAVIPEKVVRKWLFRKTQIVPMEMIATVLAIETFKDHLRGKDVLLLIDSEAVEASLVKGYSSKQDLCEIIELFWDLALELRRISLSIESLRIRIQWTGPLGISCLSAKPWDGRPCPVLGRLLLCEFVLRGGRCWAWDGLLVVTRSGRSVTCCSDHGKVVRNTGSSPRLSSAAAVQVLRSQTF